MTTLTAVDCKRIIQTEDAMDSILNALIDVDTTVFLFFNGMHAMFWDYFMPMYSGRFIWVPMYAAVLFLLYRSFGWRTATIYLLAIALTITIADQACASWIRPYVARLRPSNLDNPLSLLTQIVDGYRGGSYGFPSCHAANSMAFASFVAMMVKRWRFTLFIMLWAFINCYTRVYLGVHYPGDLLVGAVIGSAVGCLMFLLAQFAASLIDSTAPRWHRWGATIAGCRLSFCDTAIVVAVGLLTVGYIAVVAALRCLSA